MLRKRGTLLSWLALVVLPVFAQEATPNPSADDLIAKYLEAIGGRDKLKAVKTMRMSGKMTMGQGMEAPVTMEMMRPSSMRMEFTFQGMTGIQGFDGSHGWMVMPFSGKTDPEPIPEDMAKEFKEQADFEGPLVDYKEKGSTVELLGKETVEGAETYKLKVTKKDGDVQVTYLDAEYFLPIKEASKRKIQGNDVEVETSLGDYKEVNGLKFAHSIEARAKGAPGAQTITVEKIEINPTIDPSRFQMPEKKKAEEPKAEEKKAGGNP